MVSIPIALVGLRASGKSTLGPVLAERSGRGFVDLDTAILELAIDRGLVGPEATVGAVLSGLGEPAFRDLETEALTSTIAGSADVVIACGGGVVARAASRRALEGCTVIWLDPPLGTLVSRLRDEPGDRPPLLGSGDAADELAELDRRRRPYFEALASIRSVATVDPDRSARALAEYLRGVAVDAAIARELGLEFRDRSPRV